MYWSGTLETSKVEHVIFFVLLLHKLMNLNILYISIIPVILIETPNFLYLTSSCLIQVASRDFVAQSNLQDCLASRSDKTFQAHLLSPDLVTVPYEEAMVSFFTVLQC